jgi:hypothetical protein
VRPPAATPVAVVEARHLTAPCGAASCRAVRLG